MSGGASARPGHRSASRAVTRLLKFTAASLLLLGLAACDDGGEPMKTVDYVDLDRFMGDWYVVAGIVTPMEQEAYNPVERYDRAGPEKIATTFTFNKGAFDGPQKTFRPTGFIRDTKTNAEWGMRFIWPFKADYRVIYLNDDYSVTVIGRKKRDFVWIMARTPSIETGEYAQIVSLLEDFGYDAAQIRQLPHEGA
jgi:apolipoprotein D and lipocalin family protein